MQSRSLPPRVHGGRSLHVFEWGPLTADGQETPDCFHGGRAPSHHSLHGLNPRIWSQERGTWASGGSVPKRCQGGGGNPALTLRTITIAGVPNTCHRSSEKRWHFRGWRRRPRVLEPTPAMYSGTGRESRGTCPLIGSQRAKGSDPLAPPPYRAPESAREADSRARFMDGQGQRATRSRGRLPHEAEGSAWSRENCLPTIDHFVPV